MADGQLESLGRAILLSTDHLKQIAFLTFRTRNRMSFSVPFLGMWSLVRDYEAKEQGSFAVVICIISRVLLCKLQGFRD